MRRFLQAPQALTCESSVASFVIPANAESSTGRDAGAYDLVAAGVTARHFPACRIKSGVTVSVQHVSSGMTSDGTTRD